MQTLIAKRTFPSLACWAKRVSWRLPFFLLLLPFLAGCTRAVQAMPAVVETIAPAPGATPAQPAQSRDTRGPAAVGLSLETVRALFARDSDGPESDLSRLLYSTAFHSPLVAIEIGNAGSGSGLPTPTPTPDRSHSLAFVETAALTPTVPITVMLSLPVSDVAGAATPPASSPIGISLPTPTPQPPTNAGALAAPTPDGVARSVRVPILMYHYLSIPPQNSDIYRRDLSVAPELFAAHLDAMRDAGYTTITLYDLVAHLAQGAPLPEKPVVITFDDGYRDAFDNAFPLLRERDMLATFFVVTDFMDEGRPEYLSWDMAREMLAAGMKIESHGRNHVSLRDKEQDYLVWQALGSSETLEYELGARPRFVSYPAGEYDRATAELFASAGYWAGATTVQGATHSSDSVFDLKRVRVRGTTSPEELLRLLALDW